MFVILLVLLAFPVMPVCATEPRPGVDGDLLGQAKDLIDQGRPSDARTLLKEAWWIPSRHFPAYGMLVRMAIESGDEGELIRLFEAHQTFPFEDPKRFSKRVQYYERPVLQHAFDGAVRAALRREWDAAELGFSQLVGDGVFHDEATQWLFMIAMHRHQHERAEFISALARYYFPDLSRSADLLAACALQRAGQRQSALGHEIRELGLRGAYSGLKKEGITAQRAVFLAMIRLHNELDQCFLNNMKSPAQAKFLFPDLPDRILSYLARG